MSKKKNKSNSSSRWLQTKLEQNLTCFKWCNNITKFKPQPKQLLCLSFYRAASGFGSAVFGAGGGTVTGSGFKFGGTPAETTGCQ